MMEKKSDTLKFILICTLFYVTITLLEVLIK